MIILHAKLLVFPPGTYQQNSVDEVLFLANQIISATVSRTLHHHLTEETVGSGLHDKSSVINISGGVQWTKSKVTIDTIKYFRIYSESEVKETRINLTNNDI